MRKGKSLNATGFTDEEFDQLKEIKGDRTWEQAILEEFGVNEDSE